MSINVFLWDVCLILLVFLIKEDKNRGCLLQSYFQDFFDKQNETVRAKIVFTLELIEDLPRIPETYLKHIGNTVGLYEVRVQLGSNIFRIFCFFDKRN